MKIKKAVLGLLFANALMVSVLALNFKASAAEIPKYHNIPAYQQKDVYSNDRVTVQGINVNEVVNDTVSPIITKPVDTNVRFILFNTTKQEVEGRVSCVDGKLEPMHLVKGHNYMIVAESKTYRMNTIYVMVQNNKLVDIKHFPDDGKYNYPVVDEIRLYRRAEELEAFDYNRYTARIPVVYGEGPMSNVKFVLYSDFEKPIEVVCQKGMLTVELLEDIAYTVTVDDKRYEVESFPLVVKDKSEYQAGRFTYDHSSCHVVGVFAGDNVPIRLLDKGQGHKNDKVVTSLSGNTTVGGFNFKDILILDKKQNRDLGAEWKEKDYDVIDIKAVNPHRWEISKLAAGDFKVTEKIANSKQVEHLYYIDKQGELQEIPFTQIGEEIVFNMNSLSLYPIVIEYNPVKSPLRAAVKESEAYDPTDYTAATWERYSKAIAKAKELIGKEAVTVEESEAAVKEISDAKQKLTLATISAEVKAKLEASIAAAAKRKASNYTAESWKRYSEAIAKGKSLLANKNALNRDCKAALNAIVSAQKQLVTVKVHKVSISGISKKIAVGKSISLAAKVTPANAANKSVQWTTSNKKYAVVDKNGKVTTKKAGAGKKVKIIAAAKDGSNKKAVYEIQIMKHAVKSIKLTAAKSVKAGKSITVKASVKTTGKNVNKKLTWSISNKKYATVNSKGKVVTKKGGKGKTVTVTAKATDGSGKKNTVKIKIK